MSQNLCYVNEKCLKCDETFISYYTEGKFNNRNRICNNCKKKKSNRNASAYDDFSFGRQIIRKKGC